MVTFVKGEGGGGVIPTPLPKQNTKFHPPPKKNPPPTPMLQVVCASEKHTINDRNVVHNKP